MARDSAADRGAISSAAGRATAWLTAHIDAGGCVGGSRAAGLYFKVPSALALNGRRGTAALVLEWIAGHLLAAGGTLGLADEVDRSRPVNTYDFELILNTACNALVGLAWARIADIRL